MVDNFAFIVTSFNIVAFVMYGIDKNQAKKGRWRISESALLAVAVLGGSLGAYAGMKVFHHKTMKAKFYVGIPAIIIIQAALIFYIVILEVI